MDSEEHVCPVCGQPVETVVKRHKTLGAWVPVWGPGPCRNPDCAAYAETGRPADSGRSAETGRSGRTGPRPAGHERSAGAQARPGGGSGPEDPSAAGTENSAV
ncbi:hypothetical protein HCJ76_18690 [Streptomyces sp. MC1]|uniref:hypothetical protein n=1 Tax=Streptomyces sp. MC1 TaxID=295105 RepID=UPI0018C96AE5|nr:hypothetical protein [Streptomyces sp. MC1]MBG7700054.1 hypothetical protein [Streptomyces sp. MC1]